MANTIAAEPSVDERLPKKPTGHQGSALAFRNIIWQIIIFGLVGLCLWFLISNTVANLSARNIASGFGFLNSISGIPIDDAPLAYSPTTDTYRWALFMGVLNTLKVTVAGIVLSTILGTLVGIVRLSKNPLVSQLTAGYVQIARGIPLLLQLLIWYSVVNSLPRPRQSLSVLDVVYLSNRGLRLPTISWGNDTKWILLAFLLCVASNSIVLSLSRRQLAPMSSGVRRVFIWAPYGLWMILIAALASQFSVEIPRLVGFDFNGGVSVAPEFLALLIGLTIYSAAFIAEVVRGSIEAVPAGQWQAAASLGLPWFLTMRKIIFPQALSIIVPPLTNQYLNLAKHSSLAVAIGYQDIVSISNSTLNQTGQAIEGVAIIMGVYLCLSLSVSTFMNWYNVRLAMRGHRK